MAIVSTDLVAFGVASIPTDDVSTTGGNIDATSRPALDLWSAAAKVSLTSDGTDSRTAAIVGRLADGTLATESALALNGATEVLSVNTYAYVESITLSATSGTRTVTIKQGTGGTTRGTITPNETKRYSMFQNSTSEASTANRYEKVALKNGNGTNALLGANVTLSSDPASKIKIGLEPAVNATTSVANRKTAPGSVTFVDDGVSQNVPGTDLAAGAFIGCWINQTLGANDAAVRNTFGLTFAGSTTP